MIKKDSSSSFGKLLCSIMVRRRTGTQSTVFPQASSRHALPTQIYAADAASDLCTRAASPVDHRRRQKQNCYDSRCFVSRCFVHHQHPARPILSSRPCPQIAAQLRSGSRTSLSGITSSTATSIISQFDSWGNIAALSFVASFAQLLGKSTTVGKLLGAPVTAMALSFALSSIDWIPTKLSTTSTMSWTLTTLLPPGGSTASSFLQNLSLTLATPLLLLGTSIRGNELRRCGSLLASFVVASTGTLLGAIAAFSVPRIRSAMLASLPGRDGTIIAAALLAKNIGGGINYVAVCACLGASTESIAAGMCVDNVMALLYFPLTSLLASSYGDCNDDIDKSNELDFTADSCGDDSIIVGDESSSSMEALSHAFTLAAVLTSLGKFLNLQLHCGGGDSDSSKLNLSLPITTLLAVLFSTYYPPDVFLSATTTRRQRRRKGTEGGGGGNDNENDIARAGQTLGTSLLYLFFATAGAQGWRLKDTIRKSFPAIASFLVILYSVHGCVLWGAKRLVTHFNSGRRESYWTKMVEPQRLLVASSAAIGGPATAVALAKSFNWESLLTSSLLVGNVGYAIATFIGLLFYSAYI